MNITFQANDLFYVLKHNNDGVERLMVMTATSNTSDLKASSALEVPHLSNFSGTQTIEVMGNVNLITPQDVELVSGGEPFFDVYGNFYKEVTLLP